MTGKQILFNADLHFLNLNLILFGIINLLTMKEKQKYIYESLFIIYYNKDTVNNQLILEIFKTIAFVLLTVSLNHLIFFIERNLRQM